MTYNFSDSKTGQADSEPPAQPARERWYLTWWGLAVLLFILGPFGFPFLWKSKSVKLFWKWFWTGIISVITILVTWGSWKTAELVMSQYKSLGLF